MEQHGRERWEKVRAMGRPSFILRFGVLGWGLPTGLLFGLVFPLTMGMTGVGVPVTLLLSLAIFPLVGYAWGAFLWRLGERQRSKRVDQA